MLADVDLGALPELLSHLRKYRLRASVDVADVSDEHRNGRCDHERADISQFLVLGSGLVECFGSRV